VVKFSCPEEIDFVSKSCISTKESSALYFRNMIKSFKNPYVGNKKDLMVEIINILKKNDIKYNSILDLFCGSACISMMMKLMGKRVVANDILLSSSVYAEAFVKNNTVVITNDESKFIIKNDDGFDNHNHFVLDNFVDRFTKEEANNLDRIHHNIYKIFPSNSALDKTKRALVFANLQLFIMDRCFIGGRLNNGQILAKVDHRIKHHRNRGQEINFNRLEWKNLNIENDIGGHEVYNKDCINLLKENNPVVDVAYIDPPYGAAQSDYVTMYSFCESYIRQSRDIFSENCKKFVDVSNYEDNFRQLISELIYIPVWVISYNDSSWSNINKITETISEVRKIREVHAVNYQYKYRKKSDSVEYIIVA